MGDKILTGQRTARRRKREQAKEELGRPDLFTRTDIVEREYRVLPATGESVCVGDLLAVYAGDKSDQVNFVRVTRLIGFDTGEPAARLREAMLAAGREVIQVIIDKVSPFGVGSARIKKEGEGEQPRNVSS